ncbi:NAD(P)/FAD-dependent oxidoreductase [Parendozoicomonas haliclonae]|uniref:Gamma-glutamylputrescine oxidoreductase n=1 Tax=Parendozoicomonas haliclonae TaxID=1960125 RepID=A0A1X7ARR8_9GAMM|nr:FAD-binding oxidoreductase [Parendozoicomonas haliclonae]SMA50798.1 Gamma-glutamylputrescine oxidoreductase [Parendozoicomonas haliclonae]
MIKEKAPIHSDQHAASWYAATANRETNHPALEGEVTVDVCIIGAGFTGVATALELAERGYSVVVLEARKIGWGATGRNGGQLIRGIGHGADQFRNVIGQDGVDAIDQMGFEAVRLVRDRVAEHNIDCDLKMGYCDAAKRKKHLVELREDYEWLQQVGYGEETRLIDQDEIRSIVNTDAYLGGMVDMGSGHLHPLNLCLGEAELAEKLGVRFYEHSPVVRVQKGAEPVVYTAKGQVKAGRVVLAGNAYIDDLEPKLAGKVLPAGSYIITTEPLSEELCNSVLPQDFAVCDMDVALDYYRMTADNRLLFGGRCNYSARHPSDITESMRPKMLKLFPQLKDTAIDYEWGGMLGIGANRMPQIGLLEDNIYYAQAYSGHGVNATHMAARILAEAIHGDAGRLNIFNRIPHMTFPGGKHFRSPLLALGMLWHRLKEVI